MNTLANRGASTSLVTIFVGLAGLLLAPVLGWLALSGNVIVAGVATGVVAGAFLLFFPAVSVWLILTFGLIAGAGLSLLGPTASKLSWIVSLLSLALMLPALTSLLWRRSAPAFIWLSFLFLIVAVFLSLVNWHSASQLIGGFKRYFQGYGLMFALALMPFAAKQIEDWWTLLKWVAIMQFPVALAQLLILVPMRGGYGIGQATDVVAGTFGGNLMGGSNNSDLVLYCLLAAAVACSYWREGLLNGRKCFFASILFLAPLAMGETKIVVVLLPIVFFVVYRRDVYRNPFKYAPAFFLVAILSVALAFLYAEFYMGSSLAEVWEDTIRYNFEDVGYGTNLLNRLSVITFWAENQSWSHPQSFLFGNGLSASFSSAFGDSGHIARNYPGYGIDLTATPALLWDLGVVGLVLYLAILILAWIGANKVIKNSSSPVLRARALAMQVGLAISAVYLIYNNSVINLVTTEVIMGCVYGYIALLMKKHHETQQEDTVLFK